MAVTSPDIEQQAAQTGQPRSERLARRLQAVRRLDHLNVSAVNDRVAVKATIAFGSMWMFYVFFAYGFLPLLPQFKPFQDKFLYWGSWIQLWALPLLMVGGIVLNRASERRAAEDHETLMTELAEIKDMHLQMMDLLKKVERIETMVCGPTGQSDS